MNRQEFLTALEEKLRHHGLSEEKTATQVAQFSQYLSVLDPSALEQQLQNMDPDAIAQNLCGMLQDSDGAGAAEALYDDASMYPTELPEAEDAIDAEELTSQEDGVEEAPEKPKKAKRKKVKGTPLFWTLFFLSMPIWGMLLLIVCALFLGMYLVLIGGIVLFVLALVVVAVGGTALALYGIVYGIIECFASVPAGLFEIGLGVALGGAALLAGVLLYNIAIRFFPWVIGKLSVLVRFTAGKLGDLYYLIKKECR